ncbi:unnamed protein product [Porites evermanni]|uniref:Mis18 domain-containing protein n=1 Tax=Porites evermanni TaxID=104178 RepID=A0ABN8LYC5_9CNID|nr:unnamed protein product [Porites evermanni]
MAVNSHTEPEQSNFTLNLSRKEERLPFVFQCKGCNNIIGDSSAFTSSDQELEVICLNAVTSLVSSQECLETSTEGPDMGSTFRPLQCMSCKSVIGRVYRTTPRELDHFRDMFCLDVEHIRSYQVGSGSATQSIAGESDDFLDVPSAKALQNRITKIECVILMLMERMGLQDLTSKENNSTMSSNSHVTAEEEDNEKPEYKPSKKKRK